MTSFHSPVSIYGNVKDGPTADKGDVVQTQSVKLQAATAAVVEGNFFLPPLCQVIGFITDNEVLWTATTASLTVGSASAGAQFVAAVDVKANGGKVYSAVTAAQTVTLEALVTATTGTTVFVTVTSTGPNAVGTTRVTVLYKSL